MPSGMCTSRGERCSDLLKGAQADTGSNVLGSDGSSEGGRSNSEVTGFHVWPGKVERVVKTALKTAAR